jgi:hypothetical protein
MVAKWSTGAAVARSIFLLITGGENCSEGSRIKALRERPISR